MSMTLSSYQCFPPPTLTRYPSTTCTSSTPSSQVSNAVSTQNLGIIGSSLTPTCCHRLQAHVQNACYHFNQTIHLISIHTLLYLQKCTAYHIPSCSQQCSTKVAVHIQTGTDSNRKSTRTEVAIHILSGSYQYTYRYMQLSIYMYHQTAIYLQNCTTYHIPSGSQQCSTKQLSIYKQVLVDIQGVPGLKYMQLSVYCPVAVNIPTGKCCYLHTIRQLSMQHQLAIYAAPSNYPFTSTIKQIAILIPSASYQSTTMNIGSNRQLFTYHHIAIYVASESYLCSIRNLSM